MKTKLTLLMLVILSVISCKMENQSREIEKKSEVTEIELETLQDKINNEKIIVLEETRNDSMRKVVVNLELSEKISEKELKKIAKKIRKFEDADKYDNVWIFYFLKGTKENSGAWATTHYSPELEVKILGATEKEERNLKSKVQNIDGDIVGKWYEEQYTSSSIVIYKKNGKFYAKTIFKNGQEMIENLQEENVKLGTKYYDKENGVGEYYIVLKNGELGFFNKENKQYSIGRVVE